jgi:hypothetical protein
VAAKLSVIRLKGFEGCHDDIPKQELSDNLAIQASLAMLASERTEGDFK